MSGLTPHRRTPWPIVALAVAAGVIGACQIGKAAIALPELRADLGIGLGAAGWVLAIFNVIGLAAGMALGLLTGRWGDRRTLIAGLAVIAAASLAGAAAPGLATLLATRFAEGVGFLMVVIAVPTLIARLCHRDDVKLAFGIWGAYMPTGQALMMLAAPLLLAPYGWRGLWIANAALVAGFALLLAAALRGVPSATAHPPRSLARDIETIVTAPGPLLLAAIFACYSVQQLAVMGFLPTMLIERQGLAAGSAGPLAAVAVAMNGVGNLAAGGLLQRGVARWRLIAWATVLMGGAALAIYLAPLPLWASYALYLVFSGVGGMLPATVLGAAPQLAPAPHLVPAVNGLVVQGSNLGQVIGPPAVGALAAATGDWRYSPLVVTSAACLALAFTLALRRREMRG